MLIPETQRHARDKEGRKIEAELFPAVSVVAGPLVVLGSVLVECVLHSSPREIEV